MLFRMATLWIILLVFSSFLQFTNCDYIKTIVKGTIIYAKDNLTVQCVQDSLKEYDSIYSIRLSKIINEKTENLVEIVADTNRPPHFLKVVWFDIKLQSVAYMGLSRLLPVLDAKLVLHVNANNVSCKDDGIYQCSIELSGGRQGINSASVLITIPDATIQIKDTTPDSKTIYNVNDVVTLKCSASFSTPSCIRWCRKRQNDVAFKEYDLASDVVFSDISYDGCEYRRFSIMSYNVSQEDISTQFTCEITANPTCGLADGHQDIITIQNTNMDLVYTVASKTVIYKKQNLKLKCVSKKLNTDDVIDRISLSKVQYNSVALLVNAKYHQGKEETITTWYDHDFADRAVVSAMIFPKYNGTLSVEIEAQNVECWDATIYRCEMLVLGNKYSIHQEAVTLIATGKYVEVVVSSPVGLGKNGVEIECVTSYFDKEDTVNQIVLSRKQNESSTYKLLAIELVLSSNGFKTNVNWYQTELKSRTVIQSATVYPADQANLRITINANNVLCVDSGTYICEVFSSNGKHGKSESYLNITVGEVNYYKITEQTCVDSNSFYNVGHSAILRCGGKIGNPPRLPKWCRKLANDTVFRPYRNVEKIAYTTIRQIECQYESYSLLEYTVSDVDNETFFSCVSSEDKCSVSTPTESYAIKKRIAAKGSATVESSQTCYKVQIQQTGCDLIPGYIGGVIFLCILCLVLIFLSCYFYCRR